MLSPFIIATDAVPFLYAVAGFALPSSPSPLPLFFLYESRNEFNKFIRDVIIGDIVDRSLGTREDVDRERIITSIGGEGRRRRRLKCFLELAFSHGEKRVDLLFSTDLYIFLFFFLNHSVRTTMISRNSSDNGGVS